MSVDIQIAQKARLLPIKEISAKIGIKHHEIEPYGDYKAKLKPALWRRVKSRGNGKLILVTATSPTPMGEGKTTTSIGLSQALVKLGKKAIAALREPSLGPCFGMKGGAAGGGYSQVLPMEDINLHFTGDIHAVTAANNLLSAMIDNHIYHGNRLNIDKKRILWKRCLDVNDRALRKIQIGLSERKKKVSRQEGFNISVASEVMAILCLARDMDDLKRRLGRILAAFDGNGGPVYARDLKAHGAMAALLKDAVNPNLVQTLEHGAALMHGGPFANIAHGCSSLIATKLGLKLADYLITEAGFGADLGAEKFFNIKCRLSGLKPDAVVLTTTVRALEYNGRGARRDKLKKGFSNLEKHVENLRTFGINPVVAINVFPSDKKYQLDFIKAKCGEIGVRAVESHVWKRGGQGGIELAEAVLNSLKQDQPEFKLLYGNKISARQKIEKIAKGIYGAKNVTFSPKAKEQLKIIKKLKLDNLPICMAKNQYSFSDNPNLLGRPEGFSIFINELRISNGAGFIAAISGNIMTMPGLPKKPAAEEISVKGDNIIGLF